MNYYIELNVRSFACWWLVFCSLFGMYNCEDYTYFENVGMWYKFNNVGKTFDDAYSLCKDENASVAVPKNQAEMDMLMFIFELNPEIDIDSPRTDLIYIGLHDLFTEGEYLTLKGEEMQYVFNIFSESEPNNDKERCMVSNRSGKLADYSCAMKTAFICERPGPPYDKILKPTEMYSYSYELRKSYKFHTDLRTWGYARTICNAEGGHLAIITSQSEEEHLAKLLNENILLYNHPDYHIAFVGFHDIYKEGLYITVKDEKLYDLPYINWSDGEPTGISSLNCGGMNTLGHVSDYDCNHKLPYICEKSE